MTHRPMRLTMAQALVTFLGAQHTERDGRRQPFFAGMFGIFGHGNVAGVGQALEQARAAERTTVVYVRVDPAKGVPGYDSWWDVPVAEVSDQSSVQAARRAWEKGKHRQRYFL